LLSDPSGAEADDRRDREDQPGQDQRQRRLAALTGGQRDRQGGKRERELARDRQGKQHPTYRGTARPRTQQRAADHQGRRREFGSGTTNAGITSLHRCYPPARTVPATIH
jgi:hypothetical protein